MNTSAGTLSLTAIRISSSGLREPSEGKLGAEEETIDSLIGTIEHGAIEFLEVEGIVQRLADAAILKISRRMFGTNAA